MVLGLNITQNQSRFSLVNYPNVENLSAILKNINGIMKRQSQWQWTDGWMDGGNMITRIKWCLGGVGQAVTTPAANKSIE